MQSGRVRRVHLSIPIVWKFYARKRNRVQRRSESVTEVCGFRHSRRIIDFDVCEMDFRGLLGIRTRVRVTCTNTIAGSS